MARKFMCVCFGILALAIAFHLGAQYGQAEYVDHSTTGVIAMSNPGITSCLLDNGEVWDFNAGSWQAADPTFLPPIPVSDIKLWARHILISSTNELWSTAGVGSPWENEGPPPGSVTTQATTWSKIKAEFGE